MSTFSKWQFLHIPWHFQSALLSMTLPAYKALPALLTQPTPEQLLFSALSLSCRTLHDPIFVVRKYLWNNVEGNLKEKLIEKRRTVKKNSSNNLGQGLANSVMQSKSGPLLVFAEPRSWKWSLYFRKKKKSKTEYFTECKNYMKFRFQCP